MGADPPRDIDRIRRYFGKLLDEIGDLGTGFRDGIRPVGSIPRGASPRIRGGLQCDTSAGSPAADCPDTPAAHQWEELSSGLPVDGRAIFCADIGRADRVGWAACPVVDGASPGTPHSPLRGRLGGAPLHLGASRMDGSALMGACRQAHRAVVYGCRGGSGRRVAGGEPDPLLGTSPGNTRTAHARLAYRPHADHRGTSALCP